MISGILEFWYYFLQMHRFLFLFSKSTQSILSHHSKYLKQQASVTAHTGRILLGRQQKVHTQDMRASGPCRSGLNPAWVPFLYFCSPPWSPIGSVLYKIGLVPTTYPGRGMFGCIFPHPRFPFQSLDFLPLSLFLAFF